MTVPQKWTKLLLFVCWCCCLCLCSYLVSWPGWGWFLTAEMGKELLGLTLLVLKGFLQRSGSGFCIYHQCTQHPLLFLGCLGFVPLSQIAATAFPQPRWLCKTKPGMVESSPSSHCSAAMDEFVFYLLGFQLTVGCPGPVLHVAALSQQLQMLESEDSLACIYQLLPGKWWIMKPGSGNEMISFSHLITLLLIISSVCNSASLETCFVNTNDCAAVVWS